MEQMYIQIQTPQATHLIAKNHEDCSLLSRLNYIIKNVETFGKRWLSMGLLPASLDQLSDTDFESHKLDLGDDLVRAYRSLKRQKESIGSFLDFIFEDCDCSSGRLFIQIDATSDTPKIRYAFTDPMMKQAFSSFDYLQWVEEHVKKDKRANILPEYVTFTMAYPTMDSDELKSFKNKKYQEAKL